MNKMKELIDLQEKLIELKHETYSHSCNDLAILLFEIKNKIHTLEYILDTAHQALRQTRDYIDDFTFTITDDNIDILRNTIDLAIESTQTGIDVINEYRTQYDK